MESKLRTGNWNRIYYALGAFAVLSTSTAVFLSDVLLDRYAESVAVNQEWAERSGSYARWGSIAAEGNAPGNDVFENLEVDQESAKLDEIVERFEVHRDQLYADLETLDPAQAAPLRARIDAADAAFMAQVAEAREIFKAFKAGDREEAGRHMATMDRHNAQAASELGALATEIQGVQATLFAEQLEGAARIRNYEFGLIGLVLLMVLGTVAYGRKLSEIFRSAQARITKRTEDLSLVLDNVTDGLVVIDLEGRVSAEASAAFVDLLGRPDGQQTLWSMVEATDPTSAMAFEVGFESLTDGFMPTELVLAQMPQRLTHKGRTLQLEFRPIQASGQLQSVLLVTQDITEQLEGERLAAKQTEMLHLFNRVAHDRLGLEEYVAEASQMVETLRKGRGQLSLPVARRLLHTLKGNSGFFGLNRLARTCHELEDRIDEELELSEASVQELVAAWSDAEEMLDHLLGDVNNQLIEVEPEELQQALQLAEELRVPRVARALRSWEHERLTPRLERIQTQVSSLAERLNKEVRVEVDSGVRRLNTEGWESFWASLTHILRNAIDHGIESPAEREQAGKTRQGTITLRASSDGNAFVLEIADDGRGIDWSRLREKAAEQGLPASTEEDLQRVLFTDGISTADQITDISGRGVGMSAISQSVESLGGSVQVSSDLGRGTVFRFELPMSRTTPERMSA